MIFSLQTLTAAPNVACDVQSIEQHTPAYLREVLPLEDNSPALVIPYVYFEVQRQFARTRRQSFFEYLGVDVGSSRELVYHAALDRIADESRLWAILQEAVAEVDIQLAENFREKARRTRLNGVPKNVEGIRVARLLREWRDQAPEDPVYRRDTNGSGIKHVSIIRNLWTDCLIMLRTPGGRYSSYTSELIIEERLENLRAEAMRARADTSFIEFDGLSYGNDEMLISEIKDTWKPLGRPDEDPDRYNTRDVAKQLQEQKDAATRLFRGVTIMMRLVSLGGISPRLADHLRSLGFEALGPRITPEPASAVYSD